MRGLLFREFMAFAEERFGTEVVSRLTPGEPQPAWNPVAAYSHQGLLDLAEHLGDLTGSQRADLLQAYGARLFHRLAALYPGFLVGARSAFPFIAGFQAAIHDELRKLHPDSEVPGIRCTSRGADRLEVVYRSPRRLGDLAEGLLRGCADHFGERVAIDRVDVAEPGGQTVRFTLTRA
jgi:Haem-NO-binding